MNTEELISSLKQVASERLASPFWGSFISSWIVINYQFIMIIFSDNSVSTTIDLILTYSFTTWVDVITKGLLAPLAVSLLYIFAYPIPALKIYEYTLNQQIKLNNVKVSKSDIEHVPITEIAKIRTKFSLERRDLQEQITEIQNDRDALAEKVSELTKKLNELKISNLPSLSGDGFLNTLAEKDRSEIAPLQVSDDEWLVLQVIFNSNGKAYREDIWTDVNSLTPVEVDSILDDLAYKEIVDVNLSTSKGGRFSLTPKGRKLSVLLHNHFKQ